jgi:diguanylate cyclase (GGDEF)-like protein/PAS domain S-box-containing protein
MEATGTAVPPIKWHRRLHEALMPDYNRKAAAYWWTMVLLGGAALLASLWTMASLPLGVILQVTAGGVLAVVAGFFPVRIPGSKNSFVAGEIFIFLLLLMYGPQAATIAAAGEAFVGSFRSSKRWTSRIASPAMAALAMLLAGGLMNLLFELMDNRQWESPGLVLLAAMLVALAHFVANTLFVSLVFTLKRNERFALREFVSSFGSIGIAYGGSALVAALLYLTVQNSGASVLLGALPVIAMLLTTVHYFMRQQEADHAVRKGRIEAAEREAEQAALHLAALRDSEQRFHSAFTHASIGMALVAFDGRVLQANAALACLLGETRGDALVGIPFGQHVLQEDLPLLDGELSRIHDDSVNTFAVEVRCLRRTGGQIWVALHCGYFSDPSSAAPCLILQVQDISARRHAEAQLNHIAFHDGLTGLPNRGRFHALLVQALAAAKADPGAHFGVMFFDFDRFKLINDSMGHSAGDEFLIQVSRRLQDHVRPGDVVARLGGDEFAVLVHGVEDQAITTTLADRLQQVLREPMQIAGVSVTTSASIGITFSRLGYQTPEDMLRDADIAMYRAKAAGKARHVVFDADLHTEVADRLRLEADLRQALAEGQLGVEYQPLFNLATGQMHGFEALARWNHPTLGPISPEVFIPIAEETGLIIELTDLMLSRACSQLREWQLRDKSFGQLTMQINISSNDLAHSALADRVERALREAEVEPRSLTLELTENILMNRVDGAMCTLEGLRRLGVGLAIDDFGTGYSSLSYLSRLPIDTLKIDRSFVAEIHAGSNNSEVIRAIVSLGTSLGKTVVAEGIETQSQFAQLRDLGCHNGQGYHLSRPLASGGIDQLLECAIAERHFASEHFVGSGMMPMTRH